MFLEARQFEVKLQVADRIVEDIIEWIGVVSIDLVFSLGLAALGDGLALQCGHIATPGMYIAFWLSPLVTGTLWIAFGVDFFLWFLVVGAICIKAKRYLAKKKSMSAVANGRSEHESVDPQR
jgi:hypothetical protein